MFASAIRENLLTPRGLVRNDAVAMQTLVMEFDPDRFLADVLATAGSQAKMAKALGQPSSRVAELFREEGQKKRRLTMKDGLALAAAFEMDLPPPYQRLTEEKLIPVLKVCLRYAPPKWTDQDIQRLAEQLVLGLALSQALAPTQGDSDGPAPAQRPAIEQRRDKPA